MATKQSTVDVILDQLAPLGDVRARKMFGEYALYFAGKVVGLICDDTLFIKITEPGHAMMGEHQKTGCAYPGAKPSFQIAPEQIEDGRLAGASGARHSRTATCAAAKEKNKKSLN